MELAGASIRRSGLYRFNRGSNKMPVRMSNQQGAHARSTIRGNNTCLFSRERARRTQAAVRVTASYSARGPGPDPPCGKERSLLRRVARGGHGRPRRSANRAQPGVVRAPGHKSTPRLGNNRGNEQFARFRLLHRLRRRGHLPERKRPIVRRSVSDAASARDQEAPNRAGPGWRARALQTAGFGFHHPGSLRCEC